MDFKVYFQKSNAGNCLRACANCGSRPFQLIDFPEPLPPYTAL
jgi:hypothetical protein